jgi:hypothetical protein
MIHDVISARYKGGYNIEIKFDDGKHGTIDFSMYLDKGGVFDRFKDLDFFKGFSINEELGTLTWGDEIDIAPETLYAKATGLGFPDWMKAEDYSSANKTIERVWAI